MVIDDPDDVDGLDLLLWDEYDGDDAMRGFTLLKTPDGFLALGRGEVLTTTDGLRYTEVCEHKAHDIVLTITRGRYWC